MPDKLVAILFYLAEKGGKTINLSELKLPVEKLTA